MNWHGQQQAPKTQAALRDIDLCVPLAEMLQTFTGARKAGLVFRKKRGGPLSQTNVLRRYVHPIVAGGETTPGVTGRKAGFHIFRRFRTSWLRKSPWEENLITLWDGHAGRAGRIIIPSNCERMFNSGSSEHRRSG
ncbi:MAG: hypothetical protein ACRD4S_08970 [Candidatus Acidiferrales bacterium]